MVERTQDLVLVNNEAEDLAEVMEDLGMPAKFAGGLDAEQSEQLASALGRLAEHTFNQAEGGVRALIGKVHFPLRKTLYSAFALSVSLTASVLAALVEPLTGGIAIVGTVITAAQQASELITRLAPAELVVYEALATVTKQCRQNGEKSPRVTPAEVQAVFDERDEIGPNITQTLNVLRDKQVIRFEQIGAETKYWVEH